MAAHAGDCEVGVQPVAQSSGQTQAPVPLGVCKAICHPVGRQGQLQEGLLALLQHPLRHSSQSIVS